jgi:hypothetical protein
MIRNLSLCSVIALCAIVPRFITAAESQHTADYLRLHSSELLGQRVTLDVACLKPVGTVIEPAPGIALVFAQTWDEAKEHVGGEVAVLLPRDALDKALQRYGIRFDTVALRVHTTRLSGPLARSADGVFCVDLTNGAADPSSLNLRTRATLREALGRRPGLRR